MAKQRKPNVCPVSEIYIDFEQGTIKGDCRMATPETIAAALRSAGKALRKIIKHKQEDKLPLTYYCYDEGKHFCG